MFGKAKKLQEKLELCEQEKLALTRRNVELSSEVEEFRKKSEAIVKALTEAQNIADRVVKEAEEKHQEILDAAEQERLAIERDCERMKEETREKAECIVVLAEKRAAEIRQDAAKKMEETEQRVAYFRSYVKESAEAIRMQATAFGAFVSDVDSSGAGAALKGQEVPDLPENYENPAELMKNIYALQGRELPNSDVPEKKEPINTANIPEENGECHIWTVDEIVADPKAEGTDLGGDDNLNTLIDSLLDQVD